MSKNRILAFAIMLIVIMVLRISITRIPQTKAQVYFGLAGWDYPDEYGQGLSTVYLQTNETGSWVNYPDTGRGHVWFLYDDDTYLPMNYTANTALRWSVYARINHTLYDFGPDPADNASARAIMRVSMTVSTPNGSVFSLENMTWSGEVFYLGGLSPDRWEIGYGWEIADVILEAGLLYTTRFTYEIYY